MLQGCLLAILSGLLLVESYTLNASLGILVPLRWGGPTAQLDSTGLLHAMSAAMAVHDVNRRESSLVPGAHSLLLGGMLLESSIQDSEALSSVAVESAVAWNEQGMHAVVGSLRSEVTGPLALVASVESTPVITFGSTASSLADTTLYPTLSRTVFSDSVVADKTIKIIRALGWTRIAVLLVDDLWGRAFAGDLLSSANDAGVEVAASAGFPLGDRTGKMEAAIRRIAASEARVIFCVGFDADLAAIAAVADRLGMLESGHAWFVPHDFSVDNAMASSEDPAATQRHLAGWFAVTIDLLDGHRRQKFETALQSMPRDYLNRSLGGLLTEDTIASSLCDQLCATMYDAVWAAAIGISRAASATGGNSVVDKAAVLAAIRNSSFEGASGFVEFDAVTGERVSNNVTVLLKNLRPRPDDSRLSSVLTWRWRSTSSGTMERESELPPVWPGGEQSWSLPLSDTQCSAREEPSPSTRRCEACKPGTAKLKGRSQCTGFDANIGILMSFETGQVTDSVAWRWVASAAMAANHINNRDISLVPDARQLLPEGFRLVLDIQDTQATPAVAVQHVVEWNSLNVHTVIGASYSSVTGPLALAASIEATPVIAFSATASSLTDRATYPTLSRLTWHDGLLADVTIRGFWLMGWRRIAMLYVDDEWGRAFARDVMATAQEVGIIVALSVGCAGRNTPCIADALDAVARSHSRINLALMYSSDIETVSLLAEEKGMLGRGYCWLVSQGSVTTEMMQNAGTRARLAGWFTTGIDPIDGEAGEKFRRVLASQPRAHLRNAVLEASVFNEADTNFAINNTECVAHCATIYDSVWAAAIGISRAAVASSGSSTIEDRVALLAAIRNTSFDGATGRVGFDAAGERAEAGIPLVFKNLRPTGPDGELSLVSTWKWVQAGRREEEINFNGMFLEVSQEPPLWPGGNVSWHPPEDGTCSPGHYFDVDRCVPCPKGTRQNGFECTPCEPGEIALTEGVTECSQCQEGYANASGMSWCTPCPLFSERGLNSPGVSIDECECIAGNSRVDTNHGFECHPCPIGVVCQGGSSLPFPEKGWWSPGGALAFKCKVRGWCPGENVCHAGHNGVGCGVCVEDYAMDMEGCVACSDVQDRSVASDIANVAVLVIGLGLVLVVWYYFSLKPLIATESPIGSRDAKIMGMALAACTLPLSFVRALIKLSQDFAVHGKILLSFLHVLGSLVAFHVHWPSGMRSMMRWLDWLMLPGTACVVGTMSFWNRLILQTVTPLILLIVLGLPSLYVIVVSWRRHGSHDHHPRFDPVTTRFIQTANILLFLIYPVTSAYIFSSFSCTDFGADGKVLRADMRVDCSSSEYKRIEWYSVVCVLVYPIGVPAYMLAVMVGHGVRRMANAKREASQFQGLLVLRKRQTSTRMRAILANRFGWTADKEEFTRRVRGLYGMGRDGRGGEEVEEEANMDERELRAALAKFTNLPEEEVKEDEVQALMDRYDPDRNGLSTQEMTTMLHDTVDQHCMFTDHEDLHKLSIVQLRSLRNHDWTLPSASLVVLHSADDDDHEHENQHEGNHFSASMQALGAQELGERRQLSKAEKPGERDELVAWIQSKMSDLDSKGQLPQEPTAWKDDNPTERKAIQRLGFLFLSYRTDAWWFELVVLFYKLLMSSFLTLFQDSPVQISLAFLFTMILLVVVLKTRPLVNRQLFNLQVLSLFVHVLNCFFGVLVKTGALDGTPTVQNTENSSASASLTGVFLVAINCLVICLPFVQIIADYKMLRLRYKSTISKMEKMNKVSQPATERPATTSSQLVMTAGPNGKPVDLEGQTESASDQPKT